MWGLMRQEVFIIRSKNGWQLVILIYYDGVVANSVFLDHETLIEALNTASLLRIHVENEDSLPLKQYKLAG